MVKSSRRKGLDTCSYFWIMSLMQGNGLHNDLLTRLTKFPKGIEVVFLSVWRWLLWLSARHVQHWASPKQREEGSLKPRQRLGSFYFLLFISFFMGGNFQNVLFIYHQKETLQTWKIWQYIYFNILTCPFLPSFFTLHNLNTDLIWYDGGRYCGREAADVIITLASDFRTTTVILYGGSWSEI